MKKFKLRVTISRRKKIKININIFSLIKMSTQNGLIRKEISNFTNYQISNTRLIKNGK
jgi:hypothetical protein